MVAQEERLRAYAKARGYTIVKIYTDPAYSGANMDRPALKEMIRGIEKGIADVVLVYKLDRLSRSQKDTLYLIEDVFLKNNVDFVSMNESFDTTTPFGRAMIGILSVFAQLEREQIRERAMMGMEQRAKEGKWHGGGGVDKVVTGYDYIHGELIINEYEAACVRYMFELANKGDGSRTIFQKATSKYPGVIGAENTGRKVIRNPIYTGVIRYKGEEYDGVHEPIISDELFNKTQDLLAKRTSTDSPFRRSYLFSGLTYCAHCGARMSGRTGGRLKDGTPMRYYRCYTSEKSHPHMMKAESCIKKTERKEPFEELIIEKILELNIEMIEQGGTKDDYVIENIATLEKELFNIEKQVSKLMILYSLDDMPLEVITEKVEELNKDRRKIISHIEEEKNKLEMKDLDEIRKTVSQLSTFDWDNEETSAKRLLVAKLINKVIVSNDDITVEWAF